jgi:hypothetical protein
VTVVANTTDRNGQGVGPATDSIAAQGDNDNDPSTPEDTGLDLVEVQSPLISLKQVPLQEHNRRSARYRRCDHYWKDANGNRVTVSKTVPLMLQVTTTCCNSKQTVLLMVQQ